MGMQLLDDEMGVTSTAFCGTLISLSWRQYGVDEMGLLNLMSVCSHLDDVA